MHLSAIRSAMSNMDDNVLLQSCASSSEMRRGVEAVWGKTEKKKAIQQEAARSKTGIWGPTHSYDSDDDTDMQVENKKEGSSDTTKEETNSSDSPTNPRIVTPESASSNPLNRLYESAVTAMTPTSRSIKKATSSCLFKDDDDILESDVEHEHVILSKSGELLAALDPCRPCRNPICESPPPSRNPQENEKIVKTPDATNIVRDLSMAESATTPASRRRQRHMERLKAQARLEIASNSNVPAPLKTLEVKPRELERSISELTMRSSYGEATAKLAEHRRMAYYAVGKYHGRSGGNRRCYFSGKLILGGAPFYAGSVQQGLRTLVVFCLPSALGLPLVDDDEQPLSSSSNLKRQGSLTSTGSTRSKESTKSSVGFSAQPRSSIRRMRSAATGLRSAATGARSASGTATASRLSSLDDYSLSYEEEDDVNAHLDRDYLLRVLPAPSQDLLDNMADRYPEQFETLPLQVRSPHCWCLFVKFCFFSGLPIAEGEMHYKVQDRVAEQYGEEIILSHEVMEAVNGASAEILRLPNQKTFRYLQKHYTQQCGKLSDEVFKRSNWEVVLPEV